MKINADFTELHRVASQMLPPRIFTLEEAYQCGVEANLRPSRENCHYSIFEDDNLKAAWENGRNSGLV